MKGAAHFRKAMQKRNLQKARQELHGKRQPLPGKSCLPEEIAFSERYCVCGVCILAWEVLCKTCRKSLKKHLAIALVKLGMACAMYFAKRGNPSNTKPNQSNDHRNKRTVRNLQNPPASRRSPFGVCGNASLQREIGCQANQAAIRI
jgi:hypothetical protein